MRPFDVYFSRCYTTFYQTFESDDCTGLITEYRGTTPWFNPEVRTDPITVEEMEMLTHLPFPGIRIFTRRGELTEEQIFFEDIDTKSDELMVLTRQTGPGPRGSRNVVYINGDTIISPFSMVLFYRLKHREIRFEDVPVSRQVRRALGVVPEYREYITITKASVNYRNALRLSDLVKRHPQLHAVRAHFRHLQSGRVTKVRAHSRGQGKVLQPKDYIMAEDGPKA